LDAVPKAISAVKKLLGIDEAYCIAAPSDPTDEEMEGVWATLRGLTQGTASPIKQWTAGHAWQHKRITAHKCVDPMYGKEMAGG
jgi:hypothetical protein